MDESQLNKMKHNAVSLRWYQYHLDNCVALSEKAHFWLMWLFKRRALAISTVDNCYILWMQKRAHVQISMRPFDCEDAILFSYHAYNTVAYDRESMHYYVICIVVCIYKLLDGFCILRNECWFYLLLTCTFCVAVRQKCRMHSREQSPLEVLGTDRGRVRESEPSVTRFARSEPLLAWYYMMRNLVLYSCQEL